MTAPEIIAYAVFVGASSTLWLWGWNWTTLALIMSFFVVNGIWVVTGISSAFIDVLCDYAVVLAIFLKVDFEACSPFGGLWKNWGLCWAGLPLTDRIILALFLPSWAACVSPLGAAGRYWTMWACGVLQLLVASAEAFLVWRRGRAANVNAKPRGGLMREGLALPFPLLRAAVS